MMDSGNCCRLCGKCDTSTIGINSDKGRKCELSTLIAKHLPMIHLNPLPTAIDSTFFCCAACRDTLVSWDKFIITCLETEKRFCLVCGFGLQAECELVDENTEVMEIDTEEEVEENSIGFKKGSIDNQKWPHKQLMEIGKVMSVQTIMRDTDTVKIDIISDTDSDENARIDLDGIGVGITHFGGNMKHGETRASGINTPKKMKTVNAKQIDIEESTTANNKIALELKEIRETFKSTLENIRNATENISTGLETINSATQTIRTASESTEITSCSKNCAESIEEIAERMETAGTLLNKVTHYTTVKYCKFSLDTLNNMSKHVNTALKNINAARETVKYAADNIKPFTSIKTLSNSGECVLDGITDAADGIKTASDSIQPIESVIFTTECDSNATETVKPSTNSDGATSESITTALDESITTAFKSIETALDSVKLYYESIKVEIETFEFAKRRQRVLNRDRLEAAKTLVKGYIRYMCPKCTRMLTSSTTFFMHMETHDDERPYLCDTCGTQVPVCNTSRTQTMVYSDETQLGCDACRATFRRNRSLRTCTKVHI